VERIVATAGPRIYFARHFAQDSLRTSPFALRILKKLRLDLLLVARGLCESREKAQRAIMAGDVTVAGQRVDKAGTQVAEDADIAVKVADRYVGRGGHKLEAALKAFAIDPTGWTCLDIGASTGGFTDCLLQHGAAKVWAIDVGHDQMAWRIRSDSRVVVREGVNARYLDAELVPDPLDLIVIDVSFISLSLILPPAAELLKPGGVIIPLIKPQFELRREQVGKGGVVRDPELHASAVEKVRAFCASALPSLQWCGVIESPLKGGEGNTEFLACLRNTGSHTEA
jgi:23S rRNA (cytidine1920-2'-O)/16S rRNA (cytidine1409-2'-O)-methyltransferase